MSKNKKDKNKVFSIDKKQFQNSSYSTVMIVVVVAIVIFVNLIVSKIPSKYLDVDISSTQLYSISDTSKKLLKNLEEDVDIFYLVRESEKDGYPGLDKLLKKYTELSDKITLTTKDPDLYPTFGDKYEASSNTLLIVSSEKRSKAISVDELYPIANEMEASYYGETPEYTFAGENLLANAVDYVTTEHLPTVYNLTGENEVALDDTIKSLLTDANISVEDLNLLTNDQVPEDCDCLLISAPEYDFNKETAQKIIKYLKDGGNALIMAQYLGEDKEMPNFMSVLEAYGVTLEKGLVYEGNASNTYNGNKTDILPETMSTEITSDMVSANAKALMVNAQSIKQLKDNRDTLKIETLLTTSNEAYLKTDAYAKDDDGKAEKAEGDAEGPFDVAVAITDSEANAASEEEGEVSEEADTTEKETKLVVYGSYSPIDPQILQYVTSNNALMFASSIGWMCETEDSISIAAKNLDSEALMIDDDQVTKCAAVYIVLPILVFAAGVVVVIKRRRK